MNKKLARNILYVAISLASSGTYAADIYVAKTGDDNGTGAEADPYLTISKAALEAQAGDTVFIREGTYEETLKPANSGMDGSPIVFKSYDGEKVIISAMQALSGWTQHEGAIYKTDTIDWDLGQKNFVMQGSTAMDLARWPNNEDGDLFTPEALRNTGGTQGTAGNNYKDATIVYAPGIPDIDWANGGSVYFYGDSGGAGWTTWRAFINGSNSTSVTLDLNKSTEWIRTRHAPEDGGEFFLQGVLGVLDFQNEWYFDASIDTLYVQLPDDAMPADGQVSMRRREDTVDLDGRSHIEIRNLAVFGGGIEMGNASNNLIYGVTSLWGNYTLGVANSFRAQSQSVNIHGGAANNRIENSEIGFGAGSGIWDGGNDTQIVNSYIHDFNFLGDYDAVLMSRGGLRTQVHKSTLARGGRDVIQSVNDGSTYTYNDVSFSSLIADDCALFYTLGDNKGTLDRGSLLHHNWFHDAYSGGKNKRKAAGVYLDNNTFHVDVHHNVIWNTEWSGVQINHSGTNLDIFNNTMWNNSTTIAAWHKPGTAFSDVRIWNNLSQKAFSDAGNGSASQADYQNNVVEPNSPFVDLDKGDLRISAGTSPVDAGQLIAGITDDATDGSPDAGAYEIGGSDANWVAGVDWDIKAGPLNQCYGLPGEACAEPSSTPTPMPTSTPEPSPTAAPTVAPAPVAPSSGGGGGGSTDLPLLLLAASALLYRTRRAFLKKK